MPPAGAGATQHGSGSERNGNRRQDCSSRSRHARAPGSETASHPLKLDFVCFLLTGCLPRQALPPPLQLSIRSCVAQADAILSTAFSQMVEILLKKGADCNVLDEQGVSPIDEAGRAGRLIINPSCLPFLRLVLNFVMPFCLLALLSSLTFD